MSANGIFPGAADVYIRSDASRDWMWIATFASQALALSYVTSGVVPPGAEVEVRPA
jgi:hypothetical protein